MTDRPDFADKSTILQGIWGDESLFDQLVAMWETDAERRVEAIRAAVESADATALAEAAHALRGSASVFRAEAVVRPARSLEERCNVGPVDDEAERLAEEVCAAVARLTLHLRALGD